MIGLRGFSAGLLACMVAAILGGCGGGSGNSVSITLSTPDGVLSVDESEPSLTPPVFPTLNFTAAVGGDAQNKGVNWPTQGSQKSTLTGTNCSGWGTGTGECGTVTNTTPFTATYTPPSNLSTSITVTLKVTSVSDPGVTKTATITVVLPPMFTLTSCNPPSPPLDSEANPCILPSGQNGIPYISSGSNQVTISFTGGVSPYSTTIQGYATNLTLPDLCLAMTTSTTSASATISGTPCGSGTVTFQVQVVDNTNNPAAAAPPVLQWYQITVSPPPPLSIVTLSLPAAQVNASYAGAVVAQGGVPPLTWTLAPAGSLPAGITFSTSTGKFSGTPTDASLFTSSCMPAVAGKYCFTVQVQDMALPTHQVAPATPLALSITVLPPPALNITTASLPDGTTATGYSGPLVATGGVPPYTWSITQGQLPQGLTLATQGNGTGLISGTPSVVGISSFTVTVTDSEVTPKTQPGNFSIEVQPNGTTSCTSSTISSVNDPLFQGPYAYFFNGFDKDGLALIAGQLTADGKGNISSGSLNANRISGIVIGATITSGTYCIGSDGRGKMELTSTFALQQTLTEDFDLVLSSDGTAHFFEDNSTKTTTDTQFHTHGEGTLKPQLGGGFSDTDFSGHYAFLFPGQDNSGKPAALGGVVVANGASETLLPGTGDFNDAGTLSSAASITGTFAGIAGGQGSAALTFPVSGGQNTLNFEFVFVSPSDLYFIECDSSATKVAACAPGTPNPNTPRLAGEMILQNPQTQFTMTSLAGTSVASGIALNSSGNSDVFAGLLTTTICDGATPISFSYDENNGGAVGSPSFAGTCTMGLGLNGAGRAVFTGLGSSAAQAHAGTAYLTDIGTGFLMGSDTAVSTGLLEQQSGGPFADASVDGGYTLSAPFVVETNMKNVLGQVQANGVGAIAVDQLINGTTTLVSAVDEIDPPATNPPNLDQSLGANYSVAASGRGTLTTNSPVPIGFPPTAVFYVVSPNSIRMISTDTTDQHPNLLLFDH